MSADDLTEEAREFATVFAGHPDHDEAWRPSMSVSG